MKITAENWDAIRQKLIRDGIKDSKYDPQHEITQIATRGGVEPLNGHRGHRCDGFLQLYAISSLYAFRQICEHGLNDKTLNLVQIEGFLCGADGGHSEP